MVIRKYRKGEELELMEIFISSVHKNAKPYYNEKQLVAWAPSDMDFDLWVTRIGGINPFVAIDNGVILGYADLQDNGYIDHFFVRGGQSNKGIGKALMTHIIHQAQIRGIPELTSDVSLAAEGFFEKFGFCIIKKKRVLIRGVELHNALMRRQLVD
ncbi:GNAT family N-acetyltransferase [Vallitalea pronyensis]|uniref:GNAT family N-acetyltransferase n=1 Tax=Vallitalea pronyensis TaxID=1348613 RepID=A0A8J8SG65_9FIRM|nr:GNAT family N-acetyltransferase [Vallitalea pronyensis]QUI22064.1 GNAT family N-acetyltransferase [Vallitalea pronyensis]